MKFKKIGCCIISILIVLSLSACTKGDENGDLQGSISSVPNTGSNPSHIKMELGANLSIDADVTSQSDVGGIKVLDAQALTVDKQKLVSALLGNAKITKTAEYGTGESKQYEYITSDGSRLEASSNIYFATMQYYQYIKSVFCTDKTASWFNSNKYSKSSDLPFATRAAAATDVTKVLKSMGIDVSATYEGYSLDHETMKAQQYIVKNNKEYTDGMKGNTIKLKDNWDSDDDCYYFTFHPQFDGMMIDPDDHGTEDALLNGSYIDVCYSKRGIEYLSTMFLYTQTGEEKQTIQIIDSSKALQAVVNKFNTMVLTSPTKITHVRLCYAATYVDSSHKEYNLVPAWRFDMEQTIKNVKETKTNTSVNTFAVIINAVTGKEI